MHHHLLSYEVVFDGAVFAACSTNARGAGMERACSACDSNLGILSAVTKEPARSLMNAAIVVVVVVVVVVRRWFMITIGSDPFQSIPGKSFSVPKFAPVWIFLSCSRYFRNKTRKNH